MERASPVKEAPVHRFLLSIAIAFVALPVSAAPPNGRPSGGSETQTDVALEARVRAALADLYGERRAARIAIEAREGTVRVVAPELGLGESDRVRAAVQAVPGVTRVSTIVGTVIAPRPAPVVAHPGTTVIGEKSRAAQVTTGVIGEKSRMPQISAGVIGEKSRAIGIDTTGRSQLLAAPPAGSAVIGEKARAQWPAVPVDDASLERLARQRLVQHLGAQDAARVSIRVEGGVVRVEPARSNAPAAQRVADALAGLEGIRRVDNRLPR